MAFVVYLLGAYIIGPLAGLWALDYAINSCVPGSGKLGQKKFSLAFLAMIALCLLLSSFVWGYSVYVLSTPMILVAIYVSNRAGKCVLADLIIEAYNRSTAFLDEEEAERLFIWRGDEGSDRCWKCGATADEGLYLKNFRR